MSAPLARTALVTAALAAVLLVLPPAASAMFAGVEMVGRTSEATSAGKTVNVACPAGTRVTSAGFEIAPSAGRVLVNYIRPSASLSSVTVSASEDEAGTAESWWLTAYAICAPPPAGLELVKATSAASSASKGANAVCPTGKRVLGTGGEVSGSTGQLLLHGLTPSSDLTKVTAGAYEDETGTTASWTVTAYAICASPAQRLVRRNMVSAYSSGSPRAIARPCNAGEVAVGMGGAMHGTGNQLVLQAIHPAIDDRGPGVVAAEDRTGHAGTWTPEAYTICGAAINRYSVGGALVAGDPIEGVDVSCEGNGLLVGMGAETDGGRGQAWMDYIKPTGSPPGGGTVYWNMEAPRFVPVVAHGLCALAPPDTELVVGPLSDEPSEYPRRTATVSCPVGKRVLSGGSSAHTDSNVMLQSIIPSTDLRSVRVDLAETQTGTSLNWSLAATATCATAPPGLQRVSRPSAADSSEYKSITAACPAGKHVVGAGALVSPPDGQVVVDDIRFNRELTAVTVDAIEDWTGTDGEWSVTAYAVCVNR